MSSRHSRDRSQRSGGGGGNGGYDRGYGHRRRDDDRYRGRQPGVTRAGYDPHALRHRLGPPPPPPHQPPHYQPPRHHYARGVAGSHALRPMSHPLPPPHPAAFAPPPMQGGYGHPTQPQQPPQPLHHRLGPPPRRPVGQGLLSPPGLPHQQQQSSYPLPTGFAGRSVPQHRRQASSTAYPSSTSTISSQEAWDYAVHGFSTLFDKHVPLPKECFRAVKADDIFRNIEEPIDPAMAEVKDKGNSVKGRLDDMDQEVWYRLSKLGMLTSRVPYQMRTRFNAEMCSTAWVKMYEMLAHYSLLPDSEGPINTVHVCEAPGAFITATNHYIRTRFPDGEGRTWNWTGLTLNPYYEGNDHIEMISLDLFILHTLDRWCFGHDNTGDITRRENIRALWSRCKRDYSVGGVHLFTADGAFDCSANPDEQESLTAHLHFCEAVAGLGCLAKGGNMVLKLFTACERSTAALVYLVGCHFQKTFICKPATSKAANSETYLVAKGFEGIDEELKERLLRFVQPDPPRMEGKPVALLPSSLYPAAFNKTLYSAAKFFVDAFCSQIEHVLKLHRRCSHEHKQAISRAQAAVADEFASRCQLQPLPSRLRVVPHEDLNPSRLNTVVRVSDAFAQEVDQGIAGATLKERQAAAKKHKARMQAAIKGTVTGAGAEGDEGKEEGDKDTESGEPPSKRARRETREQEAKEPVGSGEVGDEAVVEEKQTSAETGASSGMAQEVAKYGAFAVSQMGKYGFQKGKGIGKEESGISEPIAIQPRPGKLGLGARTEHEHVPSLAARAATATATATATAVGTAQREEDAPFTTLLDRITETEGRGQQRWYSLGSSGGDGGGGSVTRKEQLMDRVDWALAIDEEESEGEEDGEEGKGEAHTKDEALSHDEEGHGFGADLSTSPATTAASREAGHRTGPQQEGEGEKHSSSSNNNNKKYDMVYWQKGDTHVERQQAQRTMPVQQQQQEEEQGKTKARDVESGTRQETTTGEQQEDEDKERPKMKPPQEQRQNTTPEHGGGGGGSTRDVSTRKDAHAPTATESTAEGDSRYRLAAMFEGRPQQRRNGSSGKGKRRSRMMEEEEEGEEEEDPEDDLERNAHYIYNDSHQNPVSEEEVASWPLTYRAKLPAITLSRFCRPRIFAKVVDARQGMLPIISPLLQDPRTHTHKRNSSTGSEDGTGAGVSDARTAGNKRDTLSLDEWRKLTKLRGQLLGKHSVFERRRARYMRLCLQRHKQQQQQQGKEEGEEEEEVEEHNPVSLKPSPAPLSSSAGAIAMPSCWIQDVEGFLLMRELHKRNKHWRFVRAVCLCEQAVAGAGAYLADAGVPLVLFQEHLDALPVMLRSRPCVKTAGAGSVDSAHSDADFEALAQRVRAAVAAATTETLDIQQGQQQQRLQEQQIKGEEMDKHCREGNRQAQDAPSNGSVRRSSTAFAPRANTQTRSRSRSRDGDRHRDRGRRRDRSRRSRSVSRERLHARSRSRSRSRRRSRSWSSDRESRMERDKPGRDRSSQRSGGGGEGRGRRRGRSRSRSRSRDLDRDLTRRRRRSRSRSESRERNRRSRGRSDRRSRRDRDRSRGRARSRSRSRERERSRRNRSRSRERERSRSPMGGGGRHAYDRRERHSGWDAHNGRPSVYGSEDATLWCLGIDVDAALLGGSGKGRLELDTLPHVLPQLAVLLAGMRAGDHAMVRLPDTLSRLGAGVFYVLHRSFARTRVVKPQAASPPYSSSKVVVCEHSLGPSPALTRHLARAVRLNETGAATDGDKTEAAEVAEGVEQKLHCEAQQSCGAQNGGGEQEAAITELDQGQQRRGRQDTREVLEIVPMNRLLDTRLYPIMVGWTERLLWRQAGAIEAMAKGVALCRLRRAQKSAQK